MKLREDSKDWTEDFSHENGNYDMRCIVCECVFTGHKRRMVCKECANLKCGSAPENP